MEDARLIKVLKALADINRLRMVQQIAGAGELSCGQIGSGFQLSQPTVSHHLKILVESGVLKLRADGQHHFLSVDRGLLDRLGRLLLERTAPKRRTPSGKKKSGTLNNADRRIEK